MDDQAILERFSTWKSAVDAEIRNFYTEELERRDYTSSFYRKIHAELEDFAAGGGKRLRSLLFITSYLGYTDEPEDLERLAPIAAAIELLHAFFLVHDDVVDRDETRRGQPSLHARFSGILPKGHTTERDLATIAGDLMLFHASRIFLHADFEPERILEARRILVDAGIMTGIGKLYDLLDNNRSLTQTEFEHVLFVMTYKTARYTIQMPLALGAALAGADGPTERFDELANLLGVAFQLHYDMLGISPDDERRQLKRQIEDGKKTLLLKWLYDAVPRADREFLISHMGVALTDEDFERIRQLIIDHGIKDRVEQYISELLTDSHKEIERLGMNERGVSYLNMLVKALAGQANLQ